MIKIETAAAPKVIGPYSQAVVAGDFLFVSGQIPLNRQTEKVEEASIEGQTHQVFAHIEAILKEAGAYFQDVVWVEVYLKDLQDFEVVNQIYASYFPFPIKPARQTMQVTKLPLDVRIEISCIAFLKK